MDDATVPAGTELGSGAWPVATASLYDQWLRRVQGRRRDLWAALSFTAIVGAIVVLPLIYFGFVAVRESAALIRAFAEASHNGPAHHSGLGETDPERSATGFRVSGRS